MSCVTQTTGGSLTIIERVFAAIGVVNNLVRDCIATRGQLISNTPDRMDGQNPVRAQPLQGGDIGPVVDCMRGNSMLAAMPGDEQAAAMGRLIMLHLNRVRGIGIGIGAGSDQPEL